MKKKQSLDARDDDPNKWNPDISVTSIERKVSKAIIASRPLNNSSLGFVKDTYVGAITPKSLAKMSEVNKLRFGRLNASALKLNNKKRNISYSRYHPYKLKENSNLDGLFKHKLAVLKESLSKELQKGLFDIKTNRKEHGKLFNLSFRQNN